MAKYLSRGFVEVSCSFALLWITSVWFDSCRKDYSRYKTEVNETLVNFDHDCLIFNRVTKTGSVTITNLINDLSNINNFSVYTSIDGMYVQPGDIETTLIPDLAHRKMTFTAFRRKRDLGRPFTYMKHQYWLNFQEVGDRQPLYINFVRNPIDRIVSWYYYIRSPW